ncbi:LytTR family DNA-binding domain-containing protein [Cytophagaceae bacterium DM2B3-1]|uniref:LytTR family DNA-binding domain-containing protein n=2 Tax=Xanthocytophaga TaxID=3078918 RepID=A0ABT7CLX2_9BACT|nr:MULTISPECIES: LytTR family DNA-binding domain-containing protein [Xanthocytophaga]MDJ1469702.1 LytTR family DNA-binding domain-containing protein [Xanthocytophaga flavus]MDJ1493644.1 LytTR family DNA-binding domain-containing protein [Xanthocytophaga flavus]MDJ1506403.1 LytTR family DNA-binding domain-containing protein [Xanthocytophaga agilis]
MKVVIIEDEFFSAEKLSNQLQRIDDSIEILAILPSVESCLDWFRNNPEPDLIFSDIQLEDQESFELFRQLPIEAPIIYTTAFDQYALHAFKQNSIDYLLKPIDLDELRSAIKKYENLEYRLLKKGLKLQPEKPKEGFKERFLVKKGSQLAVIRTSDVAYFKSDQKLSFLITFDNQRYVIEQTLDQLMDQLDSRKFNRISRNRLISLEAIHKIHNHFNGRLKLELNPPEEEEVYVSRDRVPQFKEWLDS